MSTLNLETPRTLGALLGTAFTLYRRHFVVFASTALLVVLVVEGLLSGFGAGLLLPGSDADAGEGWFVAAGLAQFLVATPLITAMHVRAVQAIAAGSPLRVGQAVAAGIAVLPVVALVIILSTIGIALGLLLLVIPGLYLMTIWFVCAPAAVVESLRSPTKALARSDELVDGSFWRVFGIGLLLTVMGAIGSELLAWPVFELADRLESNPIILAGVVISQAAVTSFIALTSTLLYFDLAARKRPVEAPVPESS